MSEGIKVENNIDVAKFQSVWKVSTSRIAQWQVDQGLVKPKGKSPEEDATYRAYRNKKRSNKIGKIAEALENTTRDPETFSRLERKAAIDHYPHIFEEVVSTPRYAKIKRRETPPCGTCIDEVARTSYTIRSETAPTQDAGAQITHSEECCPVCWRNYLICGLRGLQSGQTTPTVHLGTCEYRDPVGMQDLAVIVLAADLAVKSNIDVITGLEALPVTKDNIDVLSLTMLLEIRTCESWIHLIDVLRPTMLLEIRTYEYWNHLIDGGELIHTSRPKKNPGKWTKRLNAKGKAVKQTYKLLVVEGIPTAVAERAAKSLYCQIAEAAKKAACRQFVPHPISTTVSPTFAAASSGHLVVSSSVGFIKEQGPYEDPSSEDALHPMMRLPHFPVPEYRIKKEFGDSSCHGLPGNSVPWRTYHTSAGLW